MALEYESGLQNIVYQVDSEMGRKIIRGVLFSLFALAMGALYLVTNFQGLNDARAMEEAQLGRNLATEGRLLTHCVRPLSLWQVAEHNADGDARVFNHPDLLHPPVWPAILATVFRALRMPEPGTPTATMVSSWDYAPVIVGQLFIIFSAILLWAIGRKLFDARVGALSAGAFLLSDLVWRQSLTGNDWSAALFFVLGAVYAALWAAELPSGKGPEDEQGPVWRWLAPLVVAALFTAAAFLTRYLAGTVALLVFLYIGVSRRRRPWAKASLYLALAFLPVILWIWRNVAACGNPLGLVFHTMLADTYLFTGDALVRSIAPRLPEVGTAVYAVQIKWMANMREFYADGFGWGSAGMLLALFGAMFFHRFVRPSSRTLRWCILPAAGLAIFIAAAFNRESLAGTTLYWPLVIPFAWAFLLVLLDRLQFELRYFGVAAISVVMFLHGLPMLLNVLPPRTGLPYPPYFHRYIGVVSSMVEPQECLGTDIPWATAWYGGKTSILLPKDIDGYFTIHQTIQPIPVLYFTTVTRDKPWARGLADPIAPENSWYQLFSLSRAPANFPLTQGRLLAGSDQLIMADNEHWR